MIARINYIIVLLNVSRYSFKIRINKPENIFVCSILLIIDHVDYITFSPAIYKYNPIRFIEFLESFYVIRTLNECKCPFVLLPLHSEIGANLRGTNV